MPATRTGCVCRRPLVHNCLRSGTAADGCGTSAWPSPRPCTRTTRRTRRTADLWPGPARQDAHRDQAGDPMAAGRRQRSVATDHPRLRHVAREGAQGHQGAPAAQAESWDARLEEEMRSGPDAQLHQAWLPSRRRKPAPDGRHRPDHGVVPRVVRCPVFRACVPGQRRPLVRLVRRACRSPASARYRRGDRDRLGCEGDRDHNLGLARPSPCPARAEGPAGNVEVRPNDGPPSTRQRTGGLEGVQRGEEAVCEGPPEGRPAAAGCRAQVGEEGRDGPRRHRGGGFPPEVPC